MASREESGPRVHRDLHHDLLDIHDLFYLLDLYALIRPSLRGTSRPRSPLAGGATPVHSGKRGGRRGLGHVVMVADGKRSLTRKGLSSSLETSLRNNLTRAALSSMECLADWPRSAVKPRFSHPTHFLVIYTQRNDKMQAITARSFVKATPRNVQTSSRRAVVVKAQANMNKYVRREGQTIYVHQARGGGR